MDWQILAMWLVVGGVVIWIGGRILKRHVFRKGEGGDDTPPCCK